MLDPMSEAVSKAVKRQTGEYGQVMLEHKVPRGNGLLLYFCYSTLIDNPITQSPISQALRVSSFHKRSKSGPL